MMVADYNRLLVVDDDPGIGNFIAAVASDLGYEVCLTNNAPDFKRAVEEFDPTQVITDLMMPGTDGIELLRHLATVGCKAAVTVISGMDGKVVQTAMKVGENLGLKMTKVLNKPIEIADLEATLRSGAGSRGFGKALSLERFIEGLKGGEVIPVFQPKFSRTKTGWEARQAEALVRWNHPGEGLQGAGVVLALTKQGGLFLELTEVVLRETCTRLVLWAKEGMDLNVSINVPAELLTDLALPDRLANICHKAGAAPDQITLEVTESAAMEDPESAMDILTRFRLKGFKLAIDDFGTGFSSLHQLYKMPFTELKIDQSFVRDLAASDEAKVIIEISILLAKKLGLKTCAEGVETREQLDILSALECDTIQGYYFSRPLDDAAFVALLSGTS